MTVRKQFLGSACFAFGKAGFVFNKLMEFRVMISTAEINKQVFQTKKEIGLELRCRREKKGLSAWQKRPRFAAYLPTGLCG